MMASQPNIIIVTTDQQRTDTLSCYGSDFTSTPNIDRLAAEGVLCERAYCSNPVCTPARASIFSGQNVSRHGAWNVGMNVAEDIPFLSHILNPMGYRSHYIGKAHFQAFGGDAPQSWETGDKWEERYLDWNGPYYGFETAELALGHVSYGLRGNYGHWVRAQVTEEEFAAYHELKGGGGIGFGGNGYDWDLPVKLHNSVWTANQTISFLKDRDRTKPFLLAVGFQDPHHPHAVPKDFDLRVDPQEVPMPDYSEGELSDKPGHFLTARQGKLENSEYWGDFPVAGQGTGCDFSLPQEPEVRRGRAYYYTMVRLIDQQLGRILDCLDEEDLARDTIIVFTTDHGELLGDHGLWMKGPFHYEQLVKIPMIIRWPAKYTGGLQTSGLISQVDIVPTILGEFGQEIPATIDGVNQSELLTGAKENIRDRVLIECIDDPRKLRLKTIVSPNRKLTYYQGRTDGELFDLDNDPGEKVNLWDDRDYLADRVELLGMMVDELEGLELRSERYCYA